MTVDALRADHASLHGYPRDTTPGLRELSTEAVRFKWAFAPSSYTGPSHASILTGKYPSFHEVGFANGVFKATISGSIASILHGLGYATAAFVSTIVLRRSVGLDKGFEQYDDECKEPEVNRPHSLWRRGKDTAHAALRWLHQNKADDCFLWVHLMDAHGPYSPPSPFDKLFLKDQHWRDERPLVVVPDGKVGGIPAYQVLNASKNASGQLVDYKRDWNYYVSQYDGCIAYLDATLKRFVKALKAKRIWDETLLLITSDHGEAMGENGVFFFHGLSVTLDQVHVPLLLKPPKCIKTTRRVVDGAVSTLDIAPTILDVVGYDCAHLGVQGRSLFTELAHQKRSSPRFIFAETEEQCGLLTDRYQHLVPKRPPAIREQSFSLPEPLRREMLFDYRSDPLGMHDISSEIKVLTRLRPITAGFLELAELAHDRIRASRERAESQPASSGLTSEDESKIRRRLARLGYE